MKGHRDLEILSGASLICAVLALVIPLTALSLLFAIPLALFAPGYAITAATFARRSLGGAQIALLSVALSLITLVLGAFLLNYVPGGLGAVSWTLLLLIVALGGCRFAALRRAPVRREQKLLRLPVGGRDAALILGGVALAAVAIGLAMTTLPAKHAHGYTELWVTPEAGTVSGRAEIGVGSEEQHMASYVLRVQLGNGTRSLVRKFTLRPGETRTLGFHAPPSSPEAPVPVSARLFLQGRPDAVYRRVSAWIPVPRVHQ
jgi:uncharacterized membrane protein